MESKPEREALFLKSICIYNGVAMAGMNESQLQRLCSSKNVKGFKLAPYWTAEVYGFGKWLREYSGFPKFLPLCVFTDHGPPFMDIPLKTEIESGAPCIFCHSLTLTQKWRRLKKEAYVLYSPFVVCRKNLGIQKSSKAKGTLVFPAHTSEGLEDESDVEVYVKQLLALPKKFQPISVCIYYNDILNGVHKIYRKYNIPVYTAGYALDERFAERFYSILKNFKYAMSNSVGSYLYYAVEMGLPFSIYGQKQEYINKKDPNLSVGKYDPYAMSPFYRKVFKMFNGLRSDITPEQKNFVETNLGLKDAISPSQMKRILYKSLFTWTFSLRPFKQAFSVLKLLFKKR